MESHDAASFVITSMNGMMIQGRPCKCSWGKQRSSDMRYVYPVVPLPYYPTYAVPMNAYAVSAEMGYPLSPILTSPLSPNFNFNFLDEINSPVANTSFNVPIHSNDQSEPMESTESK